MMLRYRCVTCPPSAVGAMAVLVWLCVVIGVGALVLTLSFEETGVTRQRPQWIHMHGSVVLMQLRCVVDTLQVLALQLMIPSQLPDFMLLTGLAVSGTGLGPGHWPATRCLFGSSSVHASVSVLWGVAPVCACVVGVSMLLSPFVWKRAVTRPLRVWGRVSMASRQLAWVVYPSAVWAVASPEATLSRDTRRAVTWSVG